jgi:hypothetical protein
LKFEFGFAYEFELEIEIQKNTTVDIKQEFGDIIENMSPNTLQENLKHLYSQPENQTRENFKFDVVHYIRSHPRFRFLKWKDLDVKNCNGQTFKGVGFDISIPTLRHGEYRFLNCTYPRYETRFHAVLQCRDGVWSNDRPICRKKRTFKNRKLSFKTKKHDDDDDDDEDSNIPAYGIILILFGFMGITFIFALCCTKCSKRHHH